MIIEDGIEQKLSLLHRISNYLIESLSGLGILCLLFGIWEIGTQFMGSFILPSPLSVLERALELLIYKDSAIGITLYRVFLTILFSFVFGALLGILSGSFKTLARLFKPLMDICLGIPPIVWIVLALFWFGIGNVSVIFSVFIAIFPLSFANTMLSIITLDKRLDEVCIVYRLNLYKRLKYFYIPHILPHLLNALSLVNAMGIKIMIMAELLGASDGVGAKIADARSYLDTTEVLAYVVVMVGIILLFDLLVIKPLRIIFLPWQK